MKIRLRNYEVSAEAGHLLFASIMAGFIALYGGSVYINSRRTADIIFIVPGAIIMVLLYAALLWREVHITRVEPSQQDISIDPPKIDEVARKLLITQWVYVFLMILFLVALPWVGIEIATVVFTAASLWLLGSRNIPLLILLPIGFAAFVSYFFVYLLSVPIDSKLF